jgi:hypothetical protein
MARPNSAFRQVIPPGYEVYVLRLEGVTPLLMASPESDRRGKTYVAYRQLSRKRGKTTADEDRLRELEFHVLIYHDKQIGCFIPGRNVKEMLREAATKIRKGEDVRRSLVVPEYRNPQIYNGPRNPDELFDEGFYDTRMVANAGVNAGRVERTRPMFEEWALEFELAIDPEELDPEELRYAVDRAQRKGGLGDGRRGLDFGRFTAALTFRHVQQDPANADGTKARDVVEERVNKARAKELMG